MRKQASDSLTDLENITCELEELSELVNALSLSFQSAEGQLSQKQNALAVSFVYGALSSVVLNLRKTVDSIHSRDHQEIL